MITQLSTSTLMAKAMLFFFFCCWWGSTTAFVLQPNNDRRITSLNRASSSDYAFLQERVDEMRLTCIETDKQRPPNAALSPDDFCVSLLESLQSPDEPWPDAGFRTLLRCSTANWKAALYKSVGAPFPQASTEAVAAALSSHMTEDKNQFRLLVEPSVSREFPTDPLDFMDGTCWVECQLRSNQGFLLALVGFSLVKEKGAWMLDDMAWMDSRKLTMFR